MSPEWSEAVTWNGRDSADQEPGDCCLSGIDVTQEARVVPEAEYDWAIRNHMQFQAGMGGAITQNSAYGSEMDVRGNMIHLSHTVQRLWDDDYFCLFPLKLPGGGGGCRLHCLFTEPLRKAIRMYHRRPLRGGLSQLSPACAWARFVLLVCRKYESTFLAEQTRRKLGGSKVKAQWMEADQILQQRLERQRSGNPRKRGRSQSRDDWADSAAWSEGDSADEGNESPERGRSRKRSGRGISKKR